MASCGGKAVIDGAERGAGGSGGGTSTTSTATHTTTTTSTTSTTWCPQNCWNQGNGSCGCDAICNDVTYSSDCNNAPGPTDCFCFVNDANVGECIGPPGEQGCEVLAGCCWALVNGG